MRVGVRGGVRVGVGVQVRVAVSGADHEGRVEGGKRQQREDHEGRDDDGGAAEVALALEEVGEATQLEPRGRLALAGPNEEGEGLREQRDPRAAREEDGDAVAPRHEQPVVKVGERHRQVAARGEEGGGGGGGGGGEGKRRSDQGQKDGRGAAHAAAMPTRSATRRRWRSQTLLVRRRIEPESATT